MTDETTEDIKQERDRLRRIVDRYDAGWKTLAYCLNCGEGRI